MTQTLESPPHHQWLDPQHLPSTLRRYLAQELLDELRHPKWRIVAIDDDYTPSRGHPKDKPAGRGPAGQGISNPLGALYALRFTVEKVWELDIYHRHYVLLEALAYERWEKRHITGHAAVLERLLGNRATVFQQALSGYGNCKRSTIRLGTKKEDADALESLLDIAHVCRLV